MREPTNSLLRLHRKSLGSDEDGLKSESPGAQGNTEFVSPYAGAWRGMTLCHYIYILLYRIYIIYYIEYIYIFKGLSLLGLNHYRSRRRRRRRGITGQSATTWD